MCGIAVMAALVASVAGFVGAGIEPGCDRQRARGILLAAAGERSHGGTQGVLVGHRRQRLVAAQSPGEQSPHALQAGRRADMLQQPGALAQQLGHQLGIFGDRDAVGDGGQRVAQFRRGAVAGQGLDLFVLGMAQQGGGVGLVEHVEARRHAGFAREALQERLAEGMDGREVDAARRIEHAREQAAGERALPLLQFWRRRLVDQLLDFLVERGVVGHRPAAQLACKPIAHLGRGGLGEGEAENALGPHARQQQARHAIGQHLGLAGAGIGHHPGRLARHGGAALLAAGILDRIELGGHSPVPPALDHSATRSRCS